MNNKSGEQLFAALTRTLAQSHTRTALQASGERFVVARIAGKNVALVCCSSEVGLVYD